MSWKQLAWLSIASLAAVLLLVALWLLSPWFLWHLLPTEADFKVVLGSDSRVVALVPGLTEAEPLLGASSQLGMARTATGETLFIIRPTLAGYFSLPAELRQAGYRTSWYGPWLVGKRVERMEQQPFLTALWASVRTEWHAYNPLFIAEGWLPGLDQPLYAVGTVVGREWRIVVRQPGVSGTAQRSAVDRSLVAVQEDVAEVVLPGELLGSLPPDLTRQWNEALQLKLGLSKTKPDFMANLKHYQSVHLVVTAAGVRLGVVGNTARWRETVQRWLEDEERQFRIEKRSFRLPDGSLGAEYVPGPRQLRMTPSAAHPGCQEALLQQRYFWLCGENYSFLTSTEALLARSSPAEAFSLAVGKKFLPALGAAQPQAVTAAVTEQQTVIRILWASPR